MHPLVRDLYKRVILVGRDYPTNLNHVRDVWRKALRDPTNAPSCYHNDNYTATTNNNQACDREIRAAVARGRHMVREMMGIIQLKKYRTMKQRYGTTNDNDIQERMKSLEEQQQQRRTVNGKK